MKVFTMILSGIMVFSFTIGNVMASKNGYLNFTLLSKFFKTGDI